MLVVLSTSAACRSDADEPPVDPTPPPPEEESVEELQPQALESPSMQFLPREEEAPGWRLTEDPSVYPTAFLEEYLAGSDESFQLYDVIDLTVGEYETATGDGFAIVEIFRFPDFVQSFGAFSGHRSQSATMLEVENIGISTPNAVVIWRGPFLVRAIGRGGSDESSIQSLATSTIEGMPSAPGLPGAFRFLPSANRVPLSERFQREAALGQPYLANSFVADFQMGDQIVKGLVLPAPSREAAELILETWEGFFENSGSLLDPVPNLGEDNLTAEEQFMGRTVAFRIDRFVVIFNGFVERQILVDMAIDSNQRILRTIQEALRESGTD